MFKKTSLESILSTFTKTVEDLRVLQDDNFDEIAENNVKLEELAAKNVALVNENARAAKVEEKINSLLS
jgi:hypothetical protein